jgi:dTMP kinase
MHDAKVINTPGKLVAIEGIDRSGKTSSLSNIIQLLSTCRVPIVMCAEFESPLAGPIHDILANRGSAFLKTYFFACDRAHTYETKCLPALRRGEVVLWDRYVDSAIVYRTVELAREQQSIDMDFVRFMNSPFRKADLTIVLDISVSTSVNRAEMSGSAEPYDADFLQAVRDEYLKLAGQERYVVVNGEQSINGVRIEIANKIKLHLKGLFP